MKINEDKLTIHVSLDDSDFNAAMNKYKFNRALLNIEKDGAPQLFINGVTYPIVQLSYQYLTNGIKDGVNILIAEYIDGDKIKHIMIDNVTGQTTYGNEYRLKSPRNSDVKAIEELVRRGFTKQQALKAYQCLCNLS